MDWEISTDPARIHIDTVHGWLRTSYWSPNIRRDIVERAFANSVAAGAYVRGTGEQIAVARVATDRATFAWLADVWVAEPARGQGISRKLVAAVMAHPDLATVRRWLLGTRDAHGVYAPLGFAPVDPAIFMVHAPPPANWQDPQ